MLGRNTTEILETRELEKGMQEVSASLQLTSKVRRAAEAKRNLKEVRGHECKTHILIVDSIFCLSGTIL